MKRQLICLLLIFFVSPMGMSQGGVELFMAHSEKQPAIHSNRILGERFPKTNRSATNRQSKRRSNGLGASTEAGKAEALWRPFFVEYRRVVKNRDREGMRKMMSDDYSYPCGSAETPCGQPEVGINELFRVDGWQEIEQLTALGASSLLRKGYQIRCYGEAKTLSRVSPRNWTSRSRNFQDGGSLVVFEFRGGRWFFVGYSFCEIE